MTTLDDYADKYDCLRMHRTDDGVLVVRYHTDGGPFVWDLPPHEELPRAFADIGADRENRVVVITGTGDHFSGPRVTTENVHFSAPPTPAQWDVANWEARKLVMNLLDIEVPIISAINGPVYRHSELLLLNDIVLCTPDTSFEDAAHFAKGGLVPGDGVHVMLPMLLGVNRARYFMLTGQTLDAEQSLELGLVAEIHERDEVLDRAMELATQIAAKGTLQLRYTRLLFTQQMKRQMLDLLGYGMALEGLATMDR